MSWPGPVAPWEELELETDGGPESSSTSSGLPWPWLLAILAAAAWFPLDPYWQSDDFIALHYARDFRNALADFSNPQYGATDIWWFYRPFITLSFWLDNQLTGAAPFVPHLANAVVHGLSAMLVGLVWARFLAPWAAWGAALVWGLAPGAAGSILWTAGRVDGFSTLWILLSLWMLCRWIEGHRHARIGSLLAFVVALGCKELAFVVPGLAIVVCLAMASPGTRMRTGIGTRVRSALSGAWPFFLVLAFYFAWRSYALGVLVGGYTGYALEPSSALQGLGRTVLYLLNPMMYAGSETQASWLGSDPPSWIPWVGLLPALLAVGALAARKRFPLLALGVLAFLGMCLPMLPFWSASEDIKNLRQYYLPFAALAGFVAAGGVGIWVLACLVWLTPLVEVRSDYAAMHRELGAMHRQLILEATEADPQMLFVAGLPRTNAKGSALGFHFGVDRLLEPPFYSGQHRVFALRPLLDVPSVHLLTHREDYALPEGITLAFEGSSILGRRLQRNPLPELRVRLDAPERFTSDWMRQLASGAQTGALIMEGARTTHYRITVFTAGGYMAAIAEDGGDPGTVDGRVDLLDLFNTQGRYARNVPDALLTLGLQVPITIDLTPRFPVWVEAGNMVDVGGTPFFQATRSARSFLWFEFDRGFPAFVREVQGR